MIENLKKYLNYKNGFFIEVGAYDGVSYSNTIELEKSLNWKGLLIEPTFKNYLSCIKNRPNSVVCNCLLTSFKNYENKKYAFGDFDSNQNGSGGPMASITDLKFNKSFIYNLKNLYSKIRGKYSFIPVIQLPLSVLTDYLNIEKIDFFSLDVEGHEYEVLRGINFEKLYIRYICVEIRNFNKNEIFKLLKEKNFKFLENLTNFKKSTNPNYDGSHQDYLFINNVK
jgi:FkbM family methyltransferase